MTVDREALLARLTKAPEDAVVESVRALLTREDTRVISSEVNKVSVSEALRLWMTRLKNTEVTGLHLHGLHSLVGRLSDLTPRRKLEQFAFVGAEGSGNLFFEAASPHLFVGAVLIKSREKSEAAVRTETKDGSAGHILLPGDQRRVAAAS